MELSNFSHISNSGGTLDCKVLASSAIAAGDAVEEV
jgi:hypothetical protein